MKTSLLFLAALAFSYTTVSEKVTTTNCIADYNLTVKDDSTLISKIGFINGESDSARVVLMHSPGDEIALGVLHPDAALFADYWDRRKGYEEHEQYQRILKSHGINVIKILDVLLKGTISNGTIQEGKELIELRSFARRRINLVGTGLLKSELKDQNIYLDKIIAHMHPLDLVYIILNQPEVHLKKTDKNTAYTADYVVNPVMNLYFLRDQLITTKNGIVIGHLNSEQREAENDIIEFCIKKLGITPLLRISGSSYLEGGDFLCLNNISFIGQGLRTNGDAISQLLKAQVFGTEEVVVVKDRWHDQSQMHLDTWINFIDSDLVTMVSSRVNADTSSKYFVYADIYKLINGKYVLKSKDVSFTQFLTGSGIKIIPVSDEDQANYAINYLTISPRKIICVEGVSEEFTKALKESGVEIDWINFTNLKGGWGAAHCTTQVISRY